MDPLAEVELCSGFPAALLDRPGPADAEEIPSHGHRSHQEPCAAQVTSVGSGEVAAELLPAEEHPGIPLEPAHSPSGAPLEPVLPAPAQGFEKAQAEMHRDVSAPAKLISLPLCPGQSSPLCTTELLWSERLGKINKENQSYDAQGAEIGFLAQRAFLPLGAAVLSLPHWGVPHPSPCLLASSRAHLMLPKWKISRCAPFPGSLGVQ